MPQPPKTVKHHPASVNLVEIQNLMDRSSNTDTLGIDKFLMKEFQCIDKKTVTAQLSDCSYVLSAWRAAGRCSD